MPVQTSINLQCEEQCTPKQASMLPAHLELAAQDRVLPGQPCMLTSVPLLTSSGLPGNVPNMTATCTGPSTSLCLRHWT